MNLPWLDQRYLLALDDIQRANDIYGLIDPNYGMIPLDIIPQYVENDRTSEYHWKDVEKATVVIPDQWQNDPTILQYLNNLDNIIQDLSLIADH